MDLSKLDPNLVLTLATMLSTAAVWAYHKVRGDKQEDLRDKVWHVLEGVVLKLAESDDTVDALRIKLATAARDGLARMGLKSNPLTELVVAELVEKGVTEVRKRILARQTAAQLDAMLAAAGKVTTALPTVPTMPTLDIAVEVMP